MTTEPGAPARPDGSAPPRPTSANPRYQHFISHPAGVQLLSMSGRGTAFQAALRAAAVLRRDPMARTLTTRADPYPMYARLRAEGPWNRSIMGVVGTTDHAITAEVLASRQWGAVHPDPEADRFIPGVDISLLELNPPDHTRLRRIVAPLFGRRRLEAYRERMVTTLDRLFDEIPSDRPWDLMEHLATRLPVAVITDLLGIPEYDEAEFVRFGSATAAALDGIRSPAHAAELLRVRAELTRIFTRLFDERTRTPGSDAISAVVTARGEGRIAPEDMVSLCTLLLLAGFETTVNLIGSAVALLLHRREQWRMLVDDPSLAGQAVEETLRFFPPVQLAGRFALEDTEVAGRPFRRGAQVLPFIGATGRDPKVFDRPDVFDILRPNAADHLAFSAGAHYCLGAPLARMEATLALEQLAHRMPDLRLAGPVVPRRAITLRGPVRLPVDQGVRTSSPPRPR